MKREPRWVAWSMRSASNGYITRWSRWHLTSEPEHYGKTLCGKEIPLAKIQTDHELALSCIRGGDCSECKRISKETAV